MPFLQEQDAAFVRTRLAQDLRDDVTLEFFAPATGGLVLPGQDGQTAEDARQILAEVAALSPKIRLNVHSTIAEPDEAGEFPDLAERYDVYAVPNIVVNDTVEFVGAQPDAEFVRYVAQAGGLQEATPAHE